MVLSLGFGVYGLVAGFCLGVGMYGPGLGSTDSFEKRNMG